MKPIQAPLKIPGDQQCLSCLHECDGYCCQPEGVRKCPKGGICDCGQFWGEEELGDRPNCEGDRGW